MAATARRRRPHPARRRRRRGVVAAGSLVCRHGDDRRRRSPLADDVITVGSFDFAESVVLAEVYSQGLEAAGYTVERAFALGPREFVGPALAAGLVELVPEYAGTAAEFHSLGAAEPTDDVVDGARRAGARRWPGATGRRWPPLRRRTPTPSSSRGRRRDGWASRRSAIWPPSPPSCRSAARPSARARHLCLAGLDDVYGARFGEFVALDPAAR